MPEIDNIETLYKDLLFIKEHLHRLKSLKEPLEKENVLNNKYADVIKRMRKIGLESCINELKILANKFPDLNTLTPTQKNRWFLRILGLLAFAGFMVNQLFRGTWIGNVIAVVIILYVLLDEFNDNFEADEVSGAYELIEECVDQSLYIVKNLRN